jgi:hypothetical protein
VKLIVYGRSLDPEVLLVSLNGKKLEFSRADKGLLYYDVPADVIKVGKNDFSIKTSAFSGTSISKNILRGNKLLAGKTQGLWRRLFSGTPRVEKIVDGSYLLGDLGGGDNIYNFIYPWNAGVNGKTSISFKLKLKSTDSPDAVCLRTANGKYAEYLRFEPRQISLKYADKSYKIDTEKEFHTYKVELNKSAILVYVDGKLCIDAKLGTSYKKDETVFSKASFKTNYMSSNSIIIGSMSGQGKGEAYWKNISLTSSNPTLLDVALLVINEPNEKEVHQFIESKALVEKYPRLNSGNWQKLVEYKASSGKLPEEPWRKHYYSGNSKLDNGLLKLDHNQSGKKDYCYYEYRKTKEKTSRFVKVDLRVKLQDKISEPQFTLVVSMPAGNKKIRIWAFKFAADGIYSLQGKKNALTPYPLADQFHNYRVLCDTENGIAELYIDKSQTPIVSTFGRETTKYASGVKFGDASGEVKGSVALEHIDVNQME